MWAGCRWLATPGFRTASSCTVGGHAGAVLPNPCTPPGLPEAICLKLCGHGSVVQHGVVTFLGFSRWDIPDGREEPAVVEPVHPFERGIFNRSEEHTSELQSLMRISYAVFCLKKKKKN